MDEVTVALVPPAAVEYQVSKPVKEKDMPEIMFSVAQKMLVISAEHNIPVCGKIDHKNYRGTALAAIQVGISARFFVARFEFQEMDKAALIFNPSYTNSGKSMKTRSSLENSLTYKLQSYKVKRFKVIRAKYQNVDGGWIKCRLKGRDAVIFQQMCDIMDGRTIRTEATP